jgi:predicted RND superfamily exporter protein
MSLVDRYLAASRRHPLALTAAGLAVIVLGFSFSARLGLKSDFVELLPKNDRNVEVFGEVVRRVGTASSLLIGVESDDLAANERFADDLAARLKAYPRDRIARVAHHIHEEKEFFESNKYLYASYEDLVSIRDDLRRRFVAEARRRGPFALGLDDEEPDREGRGAADASEPSIDFRALEAKYRERAARYDRFVDGYFTEPGGRMLAIVVRPAGSSLQVGRAKELLDSIKRDIAALRPETYAPGMRFTFTGDVRTSVDEHDALRDDLVTVTLLCLFLEIAAILAYYRTFRALVILAFPLAAGVGVTFAITWVAIGYLSSSTAFLGSIVVGNGVNAGIILLARYMEERRAGRDVAAALGTAVHVTMPATLSASAGAGVAYGAMMLTRFRGFSQFGLIGGVGMIACWLSAYLLIPPLLVLLERAAPLARPGAPARREAPLSGPTSRWILRFHEPIVVWGTLLAVASAGVFALYLRSDPFEYDFNKLRTKQLVRSADDNARRDRVKHIFGETQAPNVILAQRADQVPLIARVLETDPEVKRFVERYETIETYLPSRQAEKLEVLREIRAELLRIRKYVGEETRRKIDAYLPPADLGPIAVDDLPKAITERFVETDGRRGLIVYAYPRKDFPSYDGRVLLEFAAATGALRLDNGEVIHTAGRPTIFAAMLSSIIHDGPRATVVAFLGVLLLAAVSFRRLKPTLLVSATVLAGVAITGALMAILGVKLNFLNFIVFPITFGIGADYAFNILRRYEADGPGSAADAVRTSGGAVALCSLTTIIGYGTLLVSDNRALNSFGALAGAGEVACLVVAVVLTPSLLIVIERRSAALRSQP